MNHSLLLSIARVEVDATIWKLPGDVRAIVKTVPVFLERRPDAADIAGGVEPDTLGIFDEGAPASPTPRIRIWLENLWDVAEGDMASFSCGGPNRAPSRNRTRPRLGRGGSRRAGFGLMGARREKSEVDPRQREYCPASVELGIRARSRQEFGTCSLFGDCTMLENHDAPKRMNGRKAVRNYESLSADA